MRLFSKHKGAVTAAAVILLVVALAVSSFFTAGRTSPVSSAINTVFRPLHALMGSITDYFTNMSDAVNKYQTLLYDYERLRVYVAQMEENVRQSDSLIEENERLRTLLGLGLRERGFELAAASILQSSVTDWEYIITLSKGGEAGIEVGQCVISAEGYLVGCVTQVGSGWAYVKTVVDTGISAGAKVERTGQTAVIEGDWSLMRENRLKLSMLPLGSDILHGDLVLTSGLGGVYPPGIPVGTVVSVRTDEGGQTEYAELAPKADIETLTQVFIVLDFNISE